MWLALTGAILVEVCATLGLRASDGFRRKVWIAPVIAGYVLSFYLLWLALSSGCRWASPTASGPRCGVALVAVIAKFLFGEPLTPVMLLGIALIVSGVFTIELAGIGPGTTH